MSHKRPRTVSDRMEKVASLLLQGATIPEMVRETGISKRSAKDIMYRMCLERGIVDGCKRVKLAVELYREQRSREL